MHRHFVIFCCGTIVVLCHQLLHAQQPKPDQISQQALKQTAQKLAEAMRSKDESAVRKLAAESVVILGNLAGVPEVVDEYRQAPQQVEPLTNAEAQAGFERILQFVKKNKWWRIGLDPTKTEHLPREVATCVVGCLAGWRANAPNKDALLKEALEAGDYLLWTQQQAGTGVIPFPAFRGGKNKAFQSADRFLRQAEKAGRLDEVVKNGWAFEDLTEGGLQFDNGLCGVAMFELYEASNEDRFLNGAISTADWALKRPCVINWNYNSFSVYLLATAYRVTHEAKYLEAAKGKARLGVLPGQLHDGPYRGRWADRHNARPAYHYIMVRGLIALFAVLPDDDPDRESIATSIRAAMQARNDEFTSKGIMNVDSSLEAILLFKSLPALQQKAIGPCQTDPAFAVLERHCVARFRNNEGPFSAGVGGNYFAWVLSQTKDRTHHALPTSGTFTLAVKSGDFDRVARVHVPTGYKADTEPPLVVLLHGGGGSGTTALEKDGWATKADREGFLLVAPEGLGILPKLPSNFRTNPCVWNSGQFSPRSPRAAIDDVAFIRQLLDVLKAKVPYDESRVFCTGHSNGGGMAFRLATELSERFAAVGAVAGLMAIENPKPKKALPTLYILGTKDPLMPVDGGEVKTPWGSRQNRPVAEPLAKWAEAIGCENEPKVVSEKDDVRKVEYPSKSNGPTLTVLYLEGHGHHWPGAKQTLPESMIGPIKSKLNATDTIWEFYQSFTETKK